MKRLLIIFLSLKGLLTFGQNTDTKQKHPIDIQQEKCHSIDSNLTTAGMINCEIIAQGEWDKEMNKYYKLLMDTLSKDDKAKLKVTQIAWLNYRDKENDFSRTMHDNMQGTMWQLVAAGRSCDIVRQRALELRAYYDSLTNN